MSELFVFTQREWIWVLVYAAALLGTLFVLLGVELGTKKLEKHVFRPTKSNAKGVFISSPNGFEKVDWKKGYDERFQMLYLQDRKTPMLNVVFPKVEDVIKACPYATTFPESYTALSMGDPRGRILRFIAPRQKEAYVSHEKAGVQIISRDYALEKNRELSSNLLELENMENLKNARKSQFENKQQFLYDLGEANEAVSKALGGMMGMMRPPGRGM